MLFSWEFTALQAGRSKDEIAEIETDKENFFRLWQIKMSQLFA